ncbi:MAG: hypothetical protein H2057_05115 [Alphaproteobacteria bacterium]|nr:hypothetical protein [Alphaproteobacteria bacterium]
MTKNVFALALLCGTIMGAAPAFTSDQEDREKGLAAAIPFVEQSVLEKARSVFNKDDLSAADLRDLSPHLSQHFPNPHEQVIFLTKTAPLSRRGASIQEKVDILGAASPFFNTAFPANWPDTARYLGIYTAPFDARSISSALTTLNQALFGIAPADQFYMLKLALPFLDYFANHDDRKENIPIILSTLARTANNHRGAVQQALLTLVPAIDLQDMDRTLEELQPLLSGLDQTELPFILSDLEPAFAGCTMDQRIQRLRTLTPFFAPLMGDERTDVMERLATVFVAGQSHPVSEQLIEALQPHILGAHAGMRSALLDSLFALMNRLNNHDTKIAFLTKVSQHFGGLAADDTLSCLKTLDVLTPGMVNIPLLKVFNGLAPTLIGQSTDNRQTLQKLAPLVLAIPVQNARTRVTLIQNASAHLHDADRFAAQGQALMGLGLSPELLPEALSFLTTLPATMPRDAAFFDDHLSYFGPTICQYWQSLEAFRTAPFDQKLQVFSKIRSLPLTAGERTPETHFVHIRELNKLYNVHPNLFHDLEFFADAGGPSLQETATFLSRVSGQTAADFPTTKPLMERLSAGEKRRFLAEDNVMDVAQNPQVLPLITLMAQTVSDGKVLALCYHHARACAANALDPALSNFGLFFKGVQSGHDALLMTTSAHFPQWGDAERKRKMSFIKKYVSTTPDGAARARAITSVSTFAMGDLASWEFYLNDVFSQIANPEKRVAFLGDLQHLSTLPTFQDKAPLLKIIKAQAVNSAGQAWDVQAHMGVYQHYGQNAQSPGWISYLSSIKHLSK